MYIEIKLSLFVFLICFCCDNVEMQQNNEKKILLTAKIYSNIFIRRREEHKLFVKHLVDSDNYEKNFKMLDLAFEKILEIINDNRMNLYQSEYDVKTGFPTDEKLQDSVTLILENTCLAGDLILHLPDIAHRTLRKRSKWKEVLLWGIDFCNEFAHVTTEETATMLDLFRQEINTLSLNPYSKENAQFKPKPTQKQKKPRKKLKKGPQLTRRSEL